MTFNNIAFAQVFPCLERVHAIGCTVIGCNNIRWLYVLVQTWVAIVKRIPHVLTLAALISGVGIGNWQAVLHKEHVNAVLWHVFEVGCDVLIVVEAVHQDTVVILLEEYHTWNIGEIFRCPHFAISGCRIALGTIV